MKVYCAASMRGGGKYSSYLDEMIRIIQDLGHTPLSESSDQIDVIVKVEGSGDQWIYDRDLEWLQRSDCLIAEVSSPSLGVGYEIAVALHKMKIPVLALCHESVPILSAMIHGNTNPLLDLERYSDLDDMSKKIGEFLSKKTVS